MASLFGLGRKKDSETAENEARNDARNVTSGAGTGTGTGSGYGRGDTASEEARNMNYEGSTSSGARSGATGSTSALSGQNTGAQTTGSQGTRTGQTGTAGYTGNTGTTGTTAGRGVGSGITEGFAGLNITHRSGFDANHPIVGNTGIVCDTKYYTAVEDRPVIKEIKTYIREHHPIEKEFVVETRPTGQEREQVQGRTQEVVDTKERVVETTVADPCGGVPTSQYSHGYTGSSGATGRGVTSGTGTGTGSYGTHNTGSTAENVKSYIPGTDANKEARYEQGRDTGRSGTGTGGYNQSGSTNTGGYNQSGNTGTGGGYGAGSGASGTGSGAGGARTIT